MARNPPAQNTPSIFYGTMDTLLGGGRAGRVLESSERRVRRRARRQDAEELQLLDRRPARDRLGHGARRDLRGVPDAQRRDGHEHQLGARSARASSTSTRRTPIRRTRRRQSRTSSCGPTSGIRTSRSASTSARASYNSAAGAAQSPLHQRPAVRGRLHLREDRRAMARRQPSGLQHAAARRRPGTRGRSTSTQWHNLVINYTWDVPNGSRMWDNALTRGLLDGWQLSGDTAFVSGDWAGATHVDDRQLRLHRRRRRHAAANQRRPQCCSGGQLRSDARRHGQLLQRRGLQPADRTRRHRQRAGDLLPDAEDRAVEHVDLQELPARRRQAHPVPLGGLQRVQPGELVDRSTRTRSSIRRASRSTRASARHDGPRTRASCRGRFRFTF